MNHLQSVIDSLPQYHLHGKPLADMTLANIGEIVNYFKRKGNDALADQFHAYMRGMELKVSERGYGYGFTQGSFISKHAWNFHKERIQLYSGRGW